MYRGDENQPSVQAHRHYWGDAPHVSNMGDGSFCLWSGVFDGYTIMLSRGEVVALVKQAVYVAGLQQGDLFEMIAEPSVRLVNQARESMAEGIGAVDMASAELVHNQTELVARSRLARARLHLLAADHVLEQLCMCGATTREEAARADAH